MTTMAVIDNDWQLDGNTTPNITATTATTIPKKHPATAFFERSHSVAVLMAGKKASAKLGVKRNVPKGGVKLELSPYGSCGYNNNKRYDDDGNDEVKRDTSIDKDFLKPIRSSSNSNSNNNHSHNKMRLEELLESNHSRMEQRRQQRRQDKKATKKLRRVLSSGQMNQLTQSMSSADIDHLKQSLHGLYKKRRDSDLLGRSSIREDTPMAHDSIPPDATTPTQLVDPSLQPSDFLLDQSRNNKNNDNRSSEIVAEESFFEESYYEQSYFEQSYLGEESYEEHSYVSSSCNSSLLRSDIDLNVDPDTIIRDDDGTECSGLSIDAYTEHCDSSITMEDLESLGDDFLEESFQTVEEGGCHIEMDTAELLGQEEYYEEEIQEEVMLIEEHKPSVVSDAETCEVSTTEEIVKDDCLDSPKTESNDKSEAEAGQTTPSVVTAVPVKNIEDAVSGKRLTWNLRNKTLGKCDASLLQFTISQKSPGENNDNIINSSKANMITPTGSRRTSKKVSALIAMFEKNCQANKAPLW